MTRTFKQRVWLTFAITMLVSAFGVGCGYLLGRVAILRSTESALEQYAVRIHGVIEAFAEESYSLMVTMNASPYPYCSDAEISYLRTLIFHSEYERDAGHMRNGKIDCSATMGRLEHPIKISVPDFVNVDGVRSYRNLPPLQTDNQKNVGVQLGDSYVVFSQHVLSHIDQPPLHYINMVLDAPSGHAGQLRGIPPNVDRQLLTKDGAYGVNGSLYVTRCSVRFRNCVTAYTSKREALQAARPQIALCTILGGLLGAFLGLFCSIIYRRSLSMERQLLRAIRKDELRMVYQPIVELASGRVVEAEALVRWTDEDGFAISPSIFVPLAEERGFVGELTEFVVRRTLSDFAEILRRHPDFRININITATDLADAKFLPMLERSLEKARVAPCSLAIEITEGSTANQQVAKEAIRHLRKVGHSVQIDDFGTGYSSLAYLHDLSVDAIKIDRAFTQVIGTDAVTVGILPQILAMAKTLNLQVIAEGIETVEQAAYFAGSEMPILGQGWLFGRPVPAKNFHSLLADAEKKASCAG